MVRELVYLHGGEVTVESELGKGSTFTVSIPLGKDHLPADRVSRFQYKHASSAVAEAFTQETRQWLRGDVDSFSENSDLSELRAFDRSTRILVADDNADLREYLLRLLSPDFDVETVGNGAEALAAIGRQIPDLILTDVMMPVMDGFGLLKAIRSDRALREIPVIMLSARAGEEAEVEGLEFGADDYLVKPFSTRELIARVKSNLELARLRKLSFIREETLRIAAQDSYERMKTFAESLPVMVAERDAWGHLRWANARYYEYTGIEAGTTPEAGGADTFHPDDREPYARHWVQARENGTDFSLEVRIRRHDGAMRWWLVTVFVIRAEDGSPDRFYVSSMDIHDQKVAAQELERRVEERTAELVEANQEMEGFTYSVSHDLRSPLRSIIFNCAILLEQLQSNLTEDQTELIHRQMRSARKLATVIDDLLKLSRVSRQELVFERVDMTAIATQVSDQIRKDSDRAGPIEIQSDMSATGDSRLLEFVFLNLIENAVKFSPEKGKIQVGSLLAGAQPTFFVKDSGIGLDTTYAEKIFQPFERLVPEEAFPGTGIGLANVKRIVERHRGQAWVESEPGQGATFFFTLGGPL